MGTHHHTWIIFVFLVEMWFYHVGQTGLKLLTSGDPSALPSQNPGIIGVCQHPQPKALLHTHTHTYTHTLELSESSESTNLEKPDSSNDSLAITGFHCVGQADFKLLTLGDPPALASQSAGTAGVSHCTQPKNSFCILFSH